MIDSDTIIRETLKRRFGESSMQLTIKGPDVSVNPFREIAAAELRRRIKEHHLPLHHGEGYVATSHWDIVTDETTYWVVRE